MNVAGTGHPPPPRALNATLINNYRSIDVEAFTSRCARVRGEAATRRHLVPINERIAARARSELSGRDLNCRLIIPAKFTVTVPLPDEVASRFAFPRGRAV